MRDTPLEVEVESFVPELPEVETVRRGLERTVLDRRIVEVTVRNAKVLKGQSEAELRERTVGRLITQAQRRGKYLLLPLADTETNRLTVPEDSSPSFFLCIHLKMRGQLRVEASDAEPGPYHCVTLLLEEALGGRKALRFYDMWTWGELRALRQEEIGTLAPSLAQMGEEPLEPSWGAANLGAKLRGRKTAIKPTLLDQRVVAGVGNIYADESLFLSGIHPERPANSLSPEETDRLAQAVRTVLTEAVEGGGTTSDNYFDVAGLPGRFTPQVYDRGGEPCSNCATTLTRIRLAGRGTVFCERCQPAVIVR
ncbi:MAG: bifunctional DNA-formamidopyrimidine glycosylase/DNA-(apurinic or apyrimidinic site) lyase [Cytophagales bacterium]|nr:bifunctional DNA-formamidopyrimidine glycosylase/DNA-(apurinic or apyrimidinic site) lyase [Armatimonadota bacterium]